MPKALEQHKDQSMKLPLASFADIFPEHMREKVESLSNRLEVEAGKVAEQSLDEPMLTGSLKSSREVRHRADGLHIGWTEVHAVMIDFGPRKSAPYQRKIPGTGRKSKFFSRRLGSMSAPQGLRRPALRAIRDSWDAIVAEAGKVLE
jgi:hypothetical protein